jgi:hypothetical protein
LEYDRLSNKIYNYYNIDGVFAEKMHATRIPAVAGLWMLNVAQIATKMQNFSRKQGGSRTEKSGYSLASQIKEHLHPCLPNSVWQKR